VFDPVRDVLYVADQDNDAIRRITRAGEVSTLAGTPGMANRLLQRGASDVLNHDTNRQPRQRRDLHAAVHRVDSKGDLILLELGYGWIRRIDPVTRVATFLTNVSRTFSRTIADGRG
jgi:hypothetical protein